MPDRSDIAGPTLDALLRRQAEFEPDRLALAVLGSGSGVERRMTVGDWASAAGRGAAYLASLGIGRGDRIALWGQNSAAWAVWLGAAAWRGASLVALHPGMTGDELTAALVRSRPQWLFIDETARGTSLVDIARVATGLACDGSPGAGLVEGLRGVSTMKGGDGAPDHESLIDAALASAAVPVPVPVPEPLSRPDDALCMLFTSGSSGRPKLVSLSHRALLLNAQRTAKAAGFVRGDRIASPLPLYHAAGMSSGLVLCLVTEALWCTTHRFQADLVMAQIKSHACTVVQGVPTMFKALIATAGKSGAPTSLRVGFIGGAAIPLPLCEQAVDVLGLEGMCAIYGQTEFGPTISATPTTERTPRSRTDGGLPIEGAGVRIVDAATGLDAAEGEIWVRGATMMQGYFEDEAATAAAVTAEGWLRTGDLGTMASGRLQVIGRLKHLIIRGGENVSPSEVEDVLREVADVSDACVVAVPSDHWGEEICACVMPAAGRPMDTAALKRWCDARLSRYKRPDLFLPFDDLPLLASGKVDRERVGRMAVERALAAARTHSAAVAGAEPVRGGAR